jgi:hypothetical protein
MTVNNKLMGTSGLNNIAMNSARMNPQQTSPRNYSSDYRSQMLQQFLNPQMRQQPQGSIRTMTTPPAQGGKPAYNFGATFNTDAGQLQAQQPTIQPLPDPAASAAAKQALVQRIAAQNMAAKPKTGMAPLADWQTRENFDETAYEAQYGDMLNKSPYNQPWDYFNKVGRQAGHTGAWFNSPSTTNNAAFGL